VKIVHISGSLHFANKNHLEKKLSNILDLHALPPKVVVVTDDGVDRSSTNSRVSLQLFLYLINFIIVFLAECGLGHVWCQLH